MGYNSERIKSIEFVEYNHVMDSFVINIHIQINEHENKTITYSMTYEEIKTLIETPDGELSELLISLKNYLKSYDIDSIKRSLFSKDFPYFVD